MIKTVIIFNNIIKLSNKDSYQAIKEFNDLDDIGMSDEFIREHNLGDLPYLQRKYSNEKNNLPLALINAAKNDIAAITIFADKESLIENGKIHSQLKQLNDLLNPIDYDGLVNGYKKENSKEIITEIILTNNDTTNAFKINEFEKFINFEKRLSIAIGSISNNDFKLLSKKVWEDEKLRKTIEICGVDRIAEDSEASVFKLCGDISYNKDWGWRLSQPSKARIYVFDKNNIEKGFSKIAESSNDSVDFRVLKKDGNKPVLSTSEHTSVCNIDSKEFELFSRLCKFGPMMKIATICNK